MSVIYVDILFILNSIVTYALLAVTARLTGSRLTKRGHLWASALGGIMAVVGYFVNFYWVFKLAMGAGIVLVSFWRQRHEWLRIWGVFMLVTLCGGGCVFALALTGWASMQGGAVYLDVGYFELLVGGGAVYFICQFILGEGGMVRRGELVAVSARFGQTVVDFTAMRDTGNLLVEPVTRKRVIAVSKGVFDGIERGEREFYPVTGVGFGGDVHILMAFAADELHIDGVKNEDYLLALTEGEIRGLQGASAVIGGLI